MIATIDRQALIDWYRRNRKRSAQLFALVEPKAYYARPIPLRHPFAFYEGHLPAFSFLTLNERSLGEEPIDTRLEKLFERGIDPGTVAAAAKAERSDWPSREAIQVFTQECDRRVENALASAEIANEAVPRLVRAEAAYTVLEHEPMHHETLLYIIHQLDNDSKLRVPQKHRDENPPMNSLVEIPAGTATLGTDRDAQPFGWDNEFERMELHVPAFSVDAFPVTNADYLNFVEAGGPVPPFWNRHNGGWHLQAAFEELPLPKSWPVYATHRMADAYANWKGMRLPTEAEYHRAAFASPAGAERPFPWGSEDPEPRFGNFNFVRYDPEPVDAHPEGASAWGVYDLVGNGWEWTSTIFGPFDGFRPMASYPQYSADFFDGRHYVMKGASPVTASELIRRSFRNWFFDDYPYMYAKFRCASR